MLKPGTVVKPSKTKLADIAVGQEADTVWFLSRASGGSSFEVRYIDRWEGQDENGDLQKWVKGMNCWMRTA